MSPSPVLAGVPERPAADSGCRCVTECRGLEARRSRYPMPVPPRTSHSSGERAHAAASPTEAWMLQLARSAADGEDGTTASKVYATSDCAEKTLAAGHASLDRQASTRSAYRLVHRSRYLREAVPRSNAHRTRNHPRAPGMRYNSVEHPSMAADHIPCGALCMT